MAAGVGAYGTSGAAFAAYQTNQGWTNAVNIKAPDGRLVPVDREKPPHNPRPTDDEATLEWDQRDIVFTEDVPESFTGENAYRAVDGFDYSLYGFEKRNGRFWIDPYNQRHVDILNTWANNANAQRRSGCNIL